jgi:formiminotetrahydrofolate cyclodeaminase
MVERAQASRLAYLPVTSFIQHTASRSPTPGGGAVAALSGSLGVGLLVMVCRLTAGKKKLAHLEASMRSRVEALLPQRDRLRELVDLDAAAFDGVMAAYALPAGSDVERSAREVALGAAFAAATEVPLEVARRCLSALEMAGPIAAEGTPNALSDAAVAGLALHTGVHGAVYNVRINLPSLPAGNLREEAEAALADWPARADTLVAEVRATVEGRLPR